MTNILPANSAMMGAQASQAETSQKMTSLRDKMARSGQTEDEMGKVAREFEAVFISEMMRPMFEGLEVDPMFGGGRGEEVFKGMLIDEYGKGMARAGGIGLADHIKQQLIYLQESQGKTAGDN